MNGVATERFRHELKFRVAQVVRNERFTPRMARITLRHPDFAAFPSLAYDDHVKLFFPTPSVPLVMPTIGPNGLIWPDGVERPAGRDYTPRSFDTSRQEITIDFVLHGDGQASTWAMSARPGDPLGVGGPRASFVVSSTFDYYVLAGDETALPAIGRRIEELPAAAKVVAVIEIANADERQVFNTRAALDLHWVERDADGQGIGATLRSAIFPTGVGYAFVAGEASVSAALRDHLLHERHFQPDHVKAVSYWRRGESDFYDGHAH